MSKILTIFFLILACESLWIKLFQKKRQDPLQRLPSYLGKSYNILKGNPFTDKVDKGFGAPVFEFTYSKNQTTDDGKYMVPDFVSSVDSTSCSLEAKCKTYSGTSSYQKELEEYAKFDLRLNVSFLDAAFTFSEAFDFYSDTTVSKKQTVAQANAECTTYTVEMPLYTNQIQMTEDFQKGVKQAFEKNAWLEFINHFGTHFTSKIVFGGRIIIQNSYMEESISFFESMKLDVDRAAQIQLFEKLGISQSEQMKRYSNQTNIINNRVETTRMSTLGGEPPKSGDWVDWQRTVKDNLAPVSFQLTSISTLFNFIHLFDQKAVIRSFEKYVSLFCTENDCPEPQPDRSDPKPLNVSFHRSSTIHGSEFNPNTFQTLDQQVKIGMRVVRVLMGSEGSIDSIQFFLSDGITEHDLQVVGNREFNHQYTVPNNDEIKCIRFGITYNNPYWKFTSMQFVTKNQQASEVFQGTFRINEYQVICLEEEDDHFVGFYGNYGSTFDSIGFNVMKETFED